MKPLGGGYSMFKWQHPKDTLNYEIIKVKAFSVWWKLRHQLLAAFLFLLKMAKLSLLHFVIAKMIPVPRQSHWDGQHVHQTGKQTHFNSIQTCAVVKVLGQSYGSIVGKTLMWLIEIVEKYLSISNQQNQHYHLGDKMGISRCHESKTKKGKDLCITRQKCAPKLTWIQFSLILEWGGWLDIGIALNIYL